MNEVVIGEETNYCYSLIEQKNIAVLVDYFLKTDFMRLLEKCCQEGRDDYGEFPNGAQEWYDFMENSFREIKPGVMEEGEPIKLIDKNTASNLAYWAENYCLSGRPDCINPKYVKGIPLRKKEEYDGPYGLSIEDFYDYCDNSNILIDDCVKYIYFKLLEYGVEISVEDKEELIEFLEPTGIKFSNKFIKETFLKIDKKYDALLDYLL